MKNKRLLYLLVPAVLLIWGIIFYQVKETLMGADPEEPPDRGLPRRKKEAAATQDTVILLANYRDPFLAGTNRTQRLPPPTRVMTKKDPPTPVQQPMAVPLSGPVWPALEYLGMIKNNGSGLHLALFSLNGEQHFVREQERLKEVSVERILKDSVKVRFGQEVKYIRKR